MDNQSRIEAFEADVAFIYDLQLQGLLDAAEAEGFITMSRSYYLEHPCNL